MSTFPVTSSSRQIPLIVVEELDPEDSLTLIERIIDDQLQRVYTELRAFFSSINLRSVSLLQYRPLLPALPFYCSPNCHKHRC